MDDVTTDDTREAIERRYGDYGRAFSALDPDAAASHWHAPSIRAFPDRVAFTPTEAERRDEFERAVADLAGTAYDHSEAVSVGVHALSETLALSNPVWDRLDADGDRIVRFSPLHLLRRTGDGWQLAARSSRRSSEALTLEAVEPGSIGLASGANVWPEPPDGIRTFFEGYARAFGTLDPQEIIPSWHVPTTFVTDEGVRSITSTADAEAMLDRLREDLGPQGYDRSEAVAVYAHRTDDSLAVADVLWHRYDADGRRIDRFAAINLLRETEGGWTLVLVAPHPPSTMVATNDPS